VKLTEPPEKALESSQGTVIALRSLLRTYYRRRENRIRITNVIPLQ
jgi:hypothetical protein